MSLGEFDFSSYKKYAENLQRKLKRANSEDLIKEILAEVGPIALANVKENTPVGQYSDGWVEFTTKSGEDVKFWARAHAKQGGTLRDGWKITDFMLGSSSGMLTLYNDVYYAEWVEKGHSTVNGGWSEGQFFLELTFEELEKMLKAIVEPKLERYIKNLFDV